jgi:Sulfatase
MLNQRLAKDTTAAPEAPLQGAASIAAASWLLPPRAVWALTFLAGLLSALYLHETEGGPASLFVGAVMLTIGALFVLILQRLLPAVVLVSATMAIIHTVAYIKQQTTEVLLHAYDVISLLSSRSALGFFWRHHREYALSLLAAVVVTVIAMWIAYRIDATRIRRMHATIATMLFVCLSFLSATAKGERRHTEFYFENVYLSFFLGSWPETIESMWGGHLIQAGSRASNPNLEVSAPCEPRTRPPHIILIHQESVVPPSHFPSLNYDRSLDPFFHSYDGQLRKLRVETYAGASWLTEFSVLTGLSTHSFRGMRQFVQQVMAGKVRETLPQALARCGYRNVVFYPMLRHFLGVGKFFEGVGLLEIFDAKAQGAKLPNERDRFYYSNLLAEMDRHFQSSNQPLFAYIETMATHGAYDYVYMPEVDVPGGGSGTDPEMHEYLRRLAMARMDYSFLRAELVRRFRDQQFLIIHYGDHQPTATWTLLDFEKGTTIEKVMQGQNAAALTTYYAIDPVRYQPPPMPALDSLDVPYLGTIILEAARLPLTDPYRERKRLMLLCKGRYHTCPAQDEILKFHRRLIDSGLLDAQ